MDRMKMTYSVKELFDKYKFVLLILGLGIVLMLLPESHNTDAPAETSPPVENALTRQEELEDILKEIEDVGKIKVLLTESAGATTIYQTDVDRSSTSGSSDTRSKTVIVSGTEREEVGLIQSITPPVYRGAIIVCQGGDRPTVKFSIVQAVSNATGIPSDRITVLKMK